MKKKYLIFITVVLILLFNFSCLAYNWCYVRWVDDGDTIVLDDGTRVRYLGINTPEIDHKDQKKEPFGYIAKKFNKKLVLSKKVRLEFGKKKHDQYNRLLAYVFLKNNIFVNAKLIEQGLAYYVPNNSKSKYNKILFESQKKAMKSKIGIWKNFRNIKMLSI